MDQVDPTRIRNRLTFGLYVEHWGERIETWGFADWSIGDGLVLLVLWNHMRWNGVLNFGDLGRFQWTWAAASCEIWRSLWLRQSSICPSWVPAKIGAHFRWEPIFGRFLVGLPGCPVGCPVGFHHPLRFAGPGPLQPVLEVQGGGGQTLEQLLPTRFLQCLIYSPVEWG